MISPSGVILNKTTVYDLHINTAFDAPADDLNGQEYNSQSYDGAVIWATPIGGYDGDIEVQLSPDGGKTWLVTDFYFLDDKTTRANSVTMAGDVVAICVIAPEAFSIRVVMSGGSAGSLKAQARIVDGRF